MAKEVSLNARIDSSGKLLVKPEGTQGEECIDLMAFLENIPGLKVVETRRLDTDNPNSSVVHEQQNT
ncbi:MAG: hypothetical protein JSS66_04635 [Armatimonadetes bacterium]|nr:hypothetical protein [Armatimonadota bacterium]